MMTAPVHEIPDCSPSRVRLCYPSGSRLTPHWRRPVSESADHSLPVLGEFVEHEAFCLPP
jgi:hypothetical protein